MKAEIEVNVPVVKNFMGYSISPMKFNGTIDLQDSLAIAEQFNAIIIGLADPVIL